MSDNIRRVWTIDEIVARLGVNYNAKHGDITDAYELLEFLAECTEFYMQSLEENDDE